MIGTHHRHMYCNESTVNPAYSVQAKGQKTKRFVTERLSQQSPGFARTEQRHLTQGTRARKPEGFRDEGVGFRAA